MTLRKNSWTERDRVKDTGQDNPAAPALISSGKFSRSQGLGRHLTVGGGTSVCSDTTAGQRHSQLL